MALTRVAPAGIGSTPGTGYVIGDSFLHATGLNATNAYYTGIVTAQTFRVIGDFQVDGTTTTLDTEVTSVDKLEIAANNTTVGVAITQSGSGDIFNLYDGATEVFSVRDGGNVGIKNATGLSEFPVDVGGEIASKNSNKEFIGINLTNNEARIRSSYYSGASGAYRPITFYTSDAERLRITSAGKIGINEISPNAQLQVKGSGNSTGLTFLTEDSSGNNSFWIQDGGKAGVHYYPFVINRDYNDTIPSSTYFYVHSASPFAIKNNGAVVIGTDTAATNAEVTVRGSSPQLSLYATPGNVSRITLGDTDDYNIGEMGYDNSDNSMFFSTNNATRLSITSDGKVGINKTNPSAILQVAGTNYQTIRLENTDNGANGPYIELYNNSNSPADGDYIGIISFKNNNSADEEITYSQIRAKSVDITDGTEDGDLTFHTRLNGSFGERVRITSDGTLNLSNGTINLGTADSSSGHINAYELMTFNIDSDNDDSNRHFTWYKNGESGGGTGMMRLDESGRLVIGGDLATSGNNLTLKHATDVEIDMHCTSGSGNNFRIKSDSNGAFTIRDHGASADRLIITDTGRIDIRGDSGASGFTLSNAYGQAGLFGGMYYNGSSWVRNASTGRIGAGFVVYTGGHGAFLSSTENSGNVATVTEKIRFSNNGNVGIGDNAPSEKLNVAGNIMLEGAEGFMYLSNVGTGNAGIYVRGNSSGSFLRSHSTGMFTWEVTGSEKMRLDSIGNLGLGCSPGNSSGYRTLQIGDGTNTGGQIWLKNGANANYYNWHDGTGVHFYGQSAGNLRFYTTAAERFRIDSGGRALLGRQRTIGGGTYYDDLTINNSNTASGADGGAGIDLISGNNSWGGYIFSDSDHHARGYLKYDHGDDALVFGTAGANRIYVDSDGKLILSSTARDNPFITGDGGMCIEQNYDGNLRALTIRNKSTNAAAGTALAFSLNRTGGDQDFLAGEIKLIKDQSWTTTSSTVDGSMVFSTIYNGVLDEKLRISADGSLKVENSDYNDLIGCTGEHSGEPNSQYKTNSKTNLTSGTWYTIAVLPTGRGFASFIIQDTGSSRHTCFYFNAGSQYGGLNYQNCINVIGASGTHNTQVFGAVRIKAYGTYDGAMLQVYIQNGASQVQAYMVGENLAPQRWRMRDWIADGTDPTGLSNWASIQANGNGLSAYADLAALTAGGASFSGPVIPGLDNTYNFGTGNRRWTTIYATNSSINTSDITLKRDVTVLNDAEMRAAANISKQFKQYRWNDSYAEKGDDARYHSGMMAQTVRDEMLAEGLDPTRYGFYCIDTWYEDSEGTRISKFYPAGSLVDEDDPAFNTPDEGEPEIPANMSLVTRYSLRYEELLCFIAAYNEQRFASLESRLSALES